MKPEQFIREYGVGVAKSVLIGLPKRCTHMTDDARMFISEHNNDLDENIRKQLPNLMRLDGLKCLVESLDEIESYGGIELFKEHVNGVALMLCGIRIHPEVKRLDQILKDHESIYGGGDE